MTNRYTKMRGDINCASWTRSSMDFSDNLTFSSPLPPPPEDALRPPSPVWSSEAPRTDARHRGHFPRQEEPATGGEIFGVILSRTCSSAASHRFACNYERGAAGTNGASAGGGLHAAVRRAFSMRKFTSSPPERYGRIHDSTVDPADAVQRDFPEEHPRAYVRTKSKKEGGALRACRKLFGF